jgi:hypothetical protein
MGKSAATSELEYDSKRGVDPNETIGLRGEQREYVWRPNPGCPEHSLDAYSDEPSA